MTSYQFNEGPKSTSRYSLGATADWRQVGYVLDPWRSYDISGWRKSDTEIAAVITFAKNNWSNKTGQVVQPADVKTARK